MTGPDTLDLGIGQTDLAIPDAVRTAVQRHLDADRAPYSDNLGTPAARRAVADHLDADHNQVMLTCGAQEALAVAIFGLIEPNDDVLVPDPGFPAFPNLVRAAGGRPVAYELERPDFGLSVDAIRDAATEQTDAIILNHPGNPTGRIPDDTKLRDILDWAQRENITWISDETYELYTYDRHHTSARDASDTPTRGIVCGGLSKSLHIMGWRLGWLATDASLVDALKPLHQHLVTCAPTFAQQVAAEVLPDIDDIFEPTFETFRRRRDVVRQRITDLPGVDSAPLDGAFYAMLDVRSHLDDPHADQSLAKSLLDQQNVALIPGSGFGPNGAGFLRLAYGHDTDTLHTAFDRLTTFFS